MSDTTSAADDAAKLLDNGWNIMLFKSELGSYTAVAFRGYETPVQAMEKENQITDDFTVSQALYRLTEKFTTGRVA